MFAQVYIAWRSVNGLLLHRPEVHLSTWGVVVLARDGVATLVEKYLVRVKHGGYTYSLQQYMSMYWRLKKTTGSVNSAQHRTLLPKPLLATIIRVLSLLLQLKVAVSYGSRSSDTYVGR